jgi:two-component system phosphate regulon sensor histidine kinase PhoR
VALSFTLWWRSSRARRETDRLRRELAATEQLRREADDQARAERQTLFNSMVEGVMLLDSQGRVLLANQSLEQLFGIHTDIRGQTLMESIRLHELAALVERLKTEQQGLSAEIELPGAAPRHFEVNAASVLDREGRPQGAIVVFHDLTRIRQLENTRREFVANVSHELRTPLSLITGCVETLLDGAKDNPAVAEKFLRTIERHSHRLSNLIEDLLTISRLESGGIKLQLEDIALREFTGKLLEEMQVRAAERNTTLLNEVPAGLRARADLDRLQQVFVNLVENAIKYGRAAGRMTVTGRARPDGQVELCVSDDGPGIPEEAKERVFERFYRADRARSRETGGTGLGLSIVKHIVQSHGGEVWVESEPGHGAKFFFTLPPG